MKILAIETSCDETAAAVVKDGKILSSVIASQALLHAKFGGVVPEVAAREHVTAIIPTVNMALKQARLDLSQIEAIAVTQGPGLVTSLLVGIETAQALAASQNKSAIPVNHMEGHIYANFVASKIKFPALTLVVSGGHTMLVLMKNHSDYAILGETVDDAAGEAFDKTAKLLGIPYPGGPALAQLALKGNPERFKFPRPMIATKDFNFSFSGLKTAVLYEVQRHKKISAKLKNDFAASIQAAILESLLAKTEKAIQQFHPQTLMLGGGVAANKILREEIKKLAKKYKIRSAIPKFEYCTDNAAMIGLAAYYKLRNNKAPKLQTFRAEPNLELK